MTDRRYLAVARPADPAGRTALDSLAARLGLSITATAAWCILHDPQSPLLPIFGDTVMLGTLFDRTTCRPVQPNARLLGDPRLPHATAQALMRQCWGRYLAFGGRSDATRFCVRDPSAGLPAFYGTRAGPLHIASGLDLLHAAGASRGDIDWSELRRHFLLSQPAVTRTCIADVQEVTAGAVLIDDHGTVRETQIWTPSRFALAGESQDISRAADQLRETVLATIGAWTSQTRRPLIEMSGGLDSSIVAAAAATTCAAATGVTLVTPGPEGDERRLAASVARHLGLPLFERYRDGERIDLRRAIAPHLPRPGVRGFTQESDRLIEEVADATGADMLFNGGGGDSLFCKLDTADPLLDHLLHGGRPGAILRTACDTADTLNVTIWALFREAWRSWRTVASGPSAGRARLMPGRPVMPSAACHPLLTGLATLPPGRRRHVRDLVAIASHTVGMARARRRPMIFPLLSQPIQEACLAYPSWLWVHEGRDRSIARTAFAPLLPEPVAYRRSKGRLDVFAYQLFVTHRATIRDMLLGGALASEQLIDRLEIERQLAGAGPTRRGAFFLLLELADIEAWVQGVRARAWDFRRSQRAY